jgi:putative membrane protein
MNNMSGKSEKKILAGIFVLSAVVFLLIVVLGFLPKSNTVPDFVKFLPQLNATINGTCFILLLFSIYFIKRKKVELHKKINITAFLLSTIFLVSYVVFHSYGVETKYPADSPIRPMYLSVLISHIILSAIVLPLILLSFYYGLTGKIKSHRKITRWSFPIWLYVTSSGVIVYLMISPYYQF